MVQRGTKGTTNLVGGGDSLKVRQRLHPGTHPPLVIMGGEGGSEAQDPKSFRANSARD